MKTVIQIAVAIAILLAWNHYFGSVERATDFQAESGQTLQVDSSWRSGQQVQGRGQVSRILSDDNEGSRHQRFIIKLSSGRTLLVAHNIDLAPRVAALRVGDTVSFNGEYEQNDRGGVIHWTHHDPRNQHPAGWIEHKGRKYQ